MLSTAPRCDFWRAARRLDFLGEVASYATSCPRSQSFAISSVCDPMPLTRLQAPESSCRFSTWSNPLDGRQRRSVCRCGRRVPAPLRCYGLRASPRLYGAPRTLLPRTLWSERAIARTLCGVRAEKQGIRSELGRPPGRAAAIPQHPPRHRGPRSGAGSGGTRSGCRSLDSEPGRTLDQPRHGSR